MDQSIKEFHICKVVIMNRWNASDRVLNSLYIISSCCLFPMGDK